MTNEAKFLIVTVIITIGVLVGGAYYFTQSSTQQSATVNMSEVLSEDSFKVGNKDSKVKIAEYSDFQCPACAATQPIVKQVLAEYGDRIYFEYHHFPLAMHNWSQVAAEAAESAGAQGKFMEYGDLLFSKQGEWSISSDVTPLFKKYAQELGLDVNKFAEALDKRTYKDKVTTSYSRGAKLQVQATPTFFVNGVKYEGGMSLEDWKKLIDAELKK